MNALIGFQIDTLISKGTSILLALEAELEQLKAPGTSVARDIIAEGVGSLAVDLFGTRKVKRYGKKVTKAWLDSERRKAANGIIGRYYQQYRTWFQETSEFVSRVSINTPRLVYPGNSGTLLRKLKRAEGFKKLETRIRHVITELEELRAHDLLLNTSLPKQLPAPPKRREPDPRQILHNLENLLRRFIERQLSRGATDWWNVLLPGDVRTRAESRKQRRETVWPWYPPTSTNNMDYLDFSDYRKIIMLQPNWDQCFKQVFASPSFVETRLGELEPIRHDIAHSRPISSLAMDKLCLYSKEIEACLKRSWNL